MIRTRDVVPPRRSEEGSMAKILCGEDVTFISVPKREKRGRVLEPVILPRLTETAWELYVCVYREGEFRRIVMPLEQARMFLTDELNRVTTAIATATTKKMEEENR